MIELGSWFISVSLTLFKRWSRFSLIMPVQSEADYKYRPFRDVWFKLALHDGSAFTLSMANAAMFLDEACHPATFQYERSGEALAYYGRSVSQVTSRLADPVDCVSEGLMTTVLGLICHDVCTPMFLSN